MDYMSLCQKYGSPLYIYNKDTLLSRIEYIKSKMDGVGIVFAIKANGFLTGVISEKTERLEVCSYGEYEICKSLNINGSKMVISGVYKEENEIRSIMNDNDVLRYTVESYNQYLLLKKVSSELNKKIDVLLRLTSGNQFGINEEEVYKIYEQEKDNVNFNVCGIQYFSGTQKHSNKRNLKEITYIKEVVDNIESRGLKVTEIEYGTGFPVFYFQEEFDEDSFLNEFRENLRLLGDKKIYLEIGRSLVASSGEYLTKVVDIKKNDVGVFAIVDGGMNHLVYYGQTMAMKIPEYEVVPNRSGKVENYNICGALCTINDIIVKQVPINDLRVGDLLIFKNTGAYTSTEGISLFLSRDLPAAIMIDKDKTILLRDRTKTSGLNGPRN